MSPNAPRILVVDDNPSMRLTLEGIIEDEGYEVVGAGDGFEAIEIARATSFDLIFMDIKMPGLNGVEAYREIKKANPRSVVVMMTGFSVEELVSEALTAGAYTVLYKPFSGEQIVAILADVLHSICVLVVDDLAAHRETLSAVLEDSGYQVTEAQDGKAAIAEVLNRRYNIILMDVVMPNMDGFTTFKEISRVDPQVKVIFVTGYALDESARQALQEGAYSVLTKPVDPDDLLTLVTSITAPQSTPA